MTTYHHACRVCEHEWREEYSYEEYDRRKAAGVHLGCPYCESTNTYRQLSAVPAHFKGGGWSPQGYYKNAAYDTHKAQGKSVKLYDRKEDIDRDMRGEAMQREQRRLKRVDVAAKRHLGPDSAVTQKEADRKISVAGDRAVQ